MLIKPCRNIWPKIHPTALAGENVTLLGDVTVDEGASLWYGAVIRGDVAPIVIGANTNIQDGCIVHNDAGIPTLIGKNVTAGHAAILHGCTVEDNCLIGMGAILMNHCVIGEGSIIAAGALITERTVIPPGSMVMGCPGKVVRQVRADELAGNLDSALRYARHAREELLPIVIEK